MTDIKRETDLAWAAGFFDGEGCTSASAKPSRFRGDPNAGRRIMISLGQKEPDMVIKFHKIIGVGVLRLNYKTCPTWQAWGYEDTKKVIELLWPYLGEIKRQQAERAFQLYVNFDGGSQVNRKHYELPAFRSAATT